MYKIECPHCGKKATFFHYDEVWVTHRAFCDCGKTIYFKIKAMEVTECTYVDKDYGYNLGN